MQNGRDTYNLVLADDHNIVRHAIKTILEKRDAFSVVAESDNAEEAIRLCEEIKPDMLILDLGLPGKSGIEAILEIKNRNLKVKIAVLTMYEDEAKLRQAILAGANGYILKKEPPEVFIAALDKILSGGLYLPAQYQELSTELNEALAGSDEKTIREQADPLQKLSKREREVFFMLADGMPNRVIAKKLFISPRTVETHRARVIKKLGFTSTAELIRFAIRNHLLSL